MLPAMAAIWGRAVRRRGLRNCGGGAGWEVASSFQGVQVCVDSLLLHALRLRKFLVHSVVVRIFGWAGREHGCGYFGIFSDLPGAATTSDSGRVCELHAN
jgi:hypothetical protein